MKNQGRRTPKSASELAGHREAVESNVIKPFALSEGQIVSVADAAARAFRKEAGMAAGKSRGKHVTTALSGKLVPRNPDAQLSEQAEDALVRAIVDSLSPFHQASK